MKIKIGFFAILILCSFIISPSPFSFAALIAAALHELGHIIAAKCLSIPLRELKLGIFGASISTADHIYSYGSEAILCASGPLVNIASFLALLPFESSAPPFISLLALASLSLAALNLLPVRGFDGGRILSALLSLIASPTAVSAVLDVLSFISLFSLWCFSLYLILRLSASLSLFIFSTALFAKLFLSERL